MFDQIVVDDPDVMNTLIDLNNVDTVLLIADKAEARRVMYGNPPTNSTSVSDCSGNKILSDYFPTFTTVLQLLLV